MQKKKYCPEDSEVIFVKSSNLFRGITLSLYAWFIIKLGKKMFFFIGVTFFYDLIT
jgi:hypothetical protein